MAKRQKLLQKITYVEENDEFIVYISSDGGKTWGFNVGAKCSRLEMQKEDEEPIGIPFGLLTTVRDNARLGFVLVVE